MAEPRFFERSSKLTWRELPKIPPTHDLFGLGQHRFSLITFGWTQIVMDVQPLIVLLTGKGHLHGFSHSVIGAAAIATFCALTAKPAVDYWHRAVAASRSFKVSWFTAGLSAAIGSASHVVLDAMMHADLQPWMPFSTENPLLGWVSIETIYRACVVVGLFGALACLWVVYRAAANEE